MKMSVMSGDMIHEGLKNSGSIGQSHGITRNLKEPYWV